MSKSKTGKKLPYRPCVGIMVLNGVGKVWAGHRVSPENGELSRSDLRWQMPQGGVDKGEDPLEAAKRELWEETGMRSVRLLARAPSAIHYDLPDELIGVALKGKYCGQALDWFAFAFEGDESEINIDNPPDGAPVEFDAWDWLDAESLPELIIPFKRQMYRQVVDCFREVIASHAKHRG